MSHQVRFFHSSDNYSTIEAMGQDCQEGRVRQPKVGRSKVLRGREKVTPGASLGDRELGSSPGGAAETVSTHRRVDLCRPAGARAFFLLPSPRSRTGLLSDAAARLPVGPTNFELPHPRKPVAFQRGRLKTKRVNLTGCSRMISIRSLCVEVEGWKNEDIRCDGSSFAGYASVSW